MPQIPLNKTIDAKKVNKRTGSVQPGPEVTVPFGALVELVSNERGRVIFVYMMEHYGCTEDLWLSATRDAAAAPAPASSPSAPSPIPAQPAAPSLQWQKLASSQFNVSRAKVPGGWLVALNDAAIAFYPDPAHAWDGLSLP